MANVIRETAPTRADNKVRLSPDVLEKAERIAAEWGLKNARAAVEAVFRKYCDDYLHGRPSPSPWPPRSLAEGRATYGQTVPVYGGLPTTSASSPPCEALDALDQLLAL
ncbi:MAG: hypothetical protein ACHWZW_12315 [Spirulina sp.]